MKYIPCMLHYSKKKLALSISCVPSDMKLSSDNYYNTSCEKFIGMFSMNILFVTTQFVSLAR